MKTKRTKRTGGPGLLDAARKLAHEYEEAVLECPTEVRVDVHLLYDLVNAIQEFDGAPKRERAKFRAVTFADPIEGEHWEGLTDGSHWNGWLNVWVTPKVYAKILRTFWPSGKDDEGGFHEIKPSDVNGTKLYFLGGGAFCASEVSE